MKKNICSAVAILFIIFDIFSLYKTNIIPNTSYYTDYSISTYSDDIINKDNEY